MPALRAALFPGGMTSREKSVNGAEARVAGPGARDFWAEEPAWNRLLAHVGYADKERLLRQLGIDLRHLDAQSPAERPMGDGVFQNLWGERYLYQTTPWGPMREDIPGALAHAESLADLEAFEWPTPDARDYSALNHQARQYEEFALVYGFADIWQRPALVRGWEGMFLDMAANPDHVHFLCRKFTTTTWKTIRGPLKLPAGGSTSTADQRSGQPARPADLGADVSPVCRALY